MLQNEICFAKIGFDEAEIEPSKIWQNLVTLVGIDDGVDVFSEGCTLDGYLFAFRGKICKLSLKVDQRR